MDIGILGQGETVIIIPILGILGPEMPDGPGEEVAGVGTGRSDDVVILSFGGAGAGRTGKTWTIVAPMLAIFLLCRKVRPRRHDLRQGVDHFSGGGLLAPPCFLLHMRGRESGWQRGQHNFPHGAKSIAPASLPCAGLRLALSFSQTLLFKEIRHAVEKTFSGQTHRHLCRGSL